MENTGQRDAIRNDIRELLAMAIEHADGEHWSTLLKDIDGVRAAAQILLDWDNDRLTREQGF